MAALVTLDETKAWLRVTYVDEDPTLELVAAAATVAVLRYLKANADPTWDQTTTPTDVKVAILRLCEDLWANRGAGAPDFQHARQADGYLSPEITALLYSRRDPTVR